MSKKKNQNNNHTTLNEVLNYYNQHNYIKASDLFKKARITQEESGIAKQLKAEIGNQLSIELLSEYKFEDAIKATESNFIVQPKPGYPLPLDKSRIITGLCYLYLGNFEKASQFLSYSIKSPHTMPFYVYYILSEVYQKKYISFKTIRDFNSLYSEYFATIEENKKLYLQAVFYLVKDDFISFHKTLKEIKPGDTIFEKNIPFLLYAHRKINNSESSLLKPLYKFISKFELTYNERHYLSRFNQIGSFLKYTETKHLNLQLSEALKELCEHCSPLEEADLKGLLSDTTYKKYYNYIIYNQTISLIEQGIELNDYKIFYLIKNFKHPFFSVPESIFAYFIFAKETKLISLHDFFNNVYLYLDIHKTNISAHYYEVICLHIFNVLQFCANFKNSEQSYKRFSEFSRYKENCFGFLFFKMIEYFFPSVVKDEREFQQIFIHPEFNEFSDYFYEQISSFVNGFKNAGAKLFLIKEATGLYIHIIQLLVKFLSSEPPVNRKSKPVLRLFSYVSLQLYESFTGNKGIIDDSALEKFSGSFLKMLKYFNEDKPESRLFNNYQQLLFSKNINEIKYLLRGNKFSELEQSYIKSISNGFERFFQGVVNEELDKLTDNSSKYNVILIMYNGYFVHFGFISEKQLETVHNLFFLKDEYLINSSFFENFLIYLLNSSDNYPQLVYNIFKYFFIKIAEQKQYGTLKFVILNKFLNFIISSVRAKSVLKYEVKFIELVLEYSERIFKKTCNKNLAVVYNNTIAALQLSRPRIIFQYKNKQKNKKQNEIENIYQKTLF
ncbi:MAG: hypothetical protein COX07_03450 [Bacteroidetes bacterium CG23_combo_of_CG06-09_8_20_14_all_32_9]|nr:MAG: hypothetical protein COX07_03450 [Bacteroidetes bacterium CG23_combo_of_CG06-09_8_20_14_all_32_9]